MKWRLILSSTLGTCWTTILHCVKDEKTKTNKQKCNIHIIWINTNLTLSFLSTEPMCNTYILIVKTGEKIKKNKNDNVYNHMHSPMVAMSIRLNIHMWTFCFLMSDLEELQCNSFSLNIMHIRIIHLIGLFSIFFFFNDIFLSFLFYLKYASCYYTYSLLISIPTCDNDALHYT